jgi:hypothetical protein
MAEKEFLKRFLSLQLRHFNCKQTQSKGVPQERYDGMAKLIKDRISFLDNFGKTFFGVSFISKPISTPLLDYTECCVLLHHHVLL